MSSYYFLLFGIFILLRMNVRDSSSYELEELVRSFESDEVSLIIFYNLQVIYFVNEVKEEPADTIKIEEELFFNDNKYISSKVGF